MSRMTFGVIFGNRDFFPDHLVTEARNDIGALFADLDINGIMLDAAATKLGGVETWSDSKRCADLFRRHADEIGFLHRDVVVPGRFQIAGDIVFLDEIHDEIPRLDRHGENLARPGFTIQFHKIGGALAQPWDHLSAVTPGSAPADAPAFQKHHGKTALSQKQRRR